MSATIDASPNAVTFLGSVPYHRSVGFSYPRQIYSMKYPHMCNDAYNERLQISTDDSRGPLIWRFIYLLYIVFSYVGFN